MKITYELDLGKFEAWSGGEETLDRILDEGKENDFEALLEELYPDGIDVTELNDLLRFETDWIYESLGMNTDEEPEEDEAEEAAWDAIKKAVKIFEDVNALCEYYAGDCDSCPLGQLSVQLKDNCYDMFNELKGESD